MLSFFLSLLNFLWATFYLFIVFPITVVIDVLGWAWLMIGYSVLFANLFLMGLLGLGLARYHQSLVIYPEYFVRCVLNPIITGVVSVIIDLIRSAYNPLICWWDAVNWFFYGFFHNVLGPDAIQCGAAQVLIDAGCVLTQLFDSLLVFLAGGKFLTGFYDMSKLSAALVQFIDSWTMMLCCLCQDICCLWVVIPFPIPGVPFPPPFNVVTVLFPDYYFWQSIESVINFFAAFMQILWPLLIDLLYLTPPSYRPAFNIVSYYAQQFFQRMGIAFERTAQRIWDRFVPWFFNFEGTFQWIVTLFCMVVDLAEMLLTIFINVDIVVFNMFTPWVNFYVGPPYTIPINVWNTTVRVIITRFINSVAPVSDPAFYINVKANYNRTTLVDGVCTVLTRIICDWTGTDVPCFNTDPNFSSEYNTGGFLQNYNFCCITNSVGTLLADFMKGLYELFLNVSGADAFFLWLDTQTNFQQLAADIVVLADCIFSLLDFVPVVGYCLKQIFVQLINFTVNAIAFLLKVVVALGTLTYDLPSGRMDRNFLFMGDLAISEWEQIVGILNADAPDSLINCLRYVLNYGVQIPPITLNEQGHFVQCPDPQCVPVDFIPPPPIIYRASAKGVLTSVGDESHLNKKFSMSRGSKVTPIMYYESERNASKPWFHPVFLKERFFAKGQEMYASKALGEVGKNVDAFFEKKKAEFWERHRVITKCHEDDMFKAALRKNDFWRYKWMMSMNKLPDTSHCIAAGAYDNIRMGLPPREQRQAFIKSSENFGLWPQVYDYLDRNMSAYSEFFLGSPDPAKGNAFSFKSQQQLTDEETAAMTASNMEDGESVYHGSSTLAPEADPRLIPPPPPLTTMATSPPIAGCPRPGHPPNPCFNLACLPAAILELVAEIMIFIPHILDGLIRGNFPDVAAGETQWGYFTGNCALRCFEVDLMNTILDLVAPLVCVCKFLNLILPSSPQFPQPDFCCALTFAGDLIANTCQTIINGIKSLALDSPRFIYFNDGYFVRDINELFEETLHIVVCLCQFVRYVFPISQLTGGSIYGGGAFDICCIPMVAADTAIELLRLVILIIVNLATIEGSGIDFWRTNPNQPAIWQIGFIQQINKTLFTFFGEPGGICAGSGKPQGIGGITSCICQILDLIMPIRMNPGAPISNDNCPFFDICCAIRGMGYVISDTLLFLFEMLASLWQSWAPADNNRCDPGVLPPGQFCSSLPNLPYAFLDFFFCNELTPEQFQMMIDMGELTPYQIIQQQKCGKFFPIINEFTLLISTCPCQIFSLVDMWLSEVYGHTVDCFCGQVDGVLTNIGTLVNAICVALITLIRRIDDPNYWQPFGAPGPNNPMNNGFSETNTWTWNFFAPMIDSACNLVAAATCFLDLLLPFCSESRKRIVRSAFRWPLEIVILIGAFIEGFVGLLTTPATCLPPGQTQPPDQLNSQQQGVCPTGSSFYGVSIDDLATVFIALAAVPINALFADSSVVCSMLNPPQCPVSNPCCCYNNPTTGAQMFTFVTTGSVFSQPGYQCAQCVGPDMCTQYIDSYAYKTCAAIGDPQQRCFEDCTQSTGNSETGCLVSCDLNNPGLTKLDGVIMALLRYFQCLLIQIFPPFGYIVQGIIIMISVLWQLTNSLIRVLAAVIMFVLSLFTAFSGGCACYGSGKNFVDVNGLCYQCLEIWPDNPATCTFVVDYTLTFQTYAYNVGTSFTAGQSVPCKNLGHSPNCLAGGRDSSEPTNVTANYPGVVNTCADTTYVGVVTVTNQAANLPPGLIYLDNTFGRPGPGVCCAANIIPNGYQPGQTSCVGGPGGIGGVTCGIIQLVQNFFNIFSAIAAVFTTGPVIPNQPAFKRHGHSVSGMGQMRWQDPLENYSQFAERMRLGQTRERYLHLKEVQAGGERARVARGKIMDYGNENPPVAMDSVTAFFEAVWGFSTDDTMTNFPESMCRIWKGMPGHMCTPQALSKRDASMTIINHVAHDMNGTSPCDNHLRAFNDTLWNDVWISDRVYYIDCVERVVQGTRMNEIYPTFPKDYYYRHDGGLLLLNNIIADSQKFLRDDHIRVNEDREQEHRKKRSEPGQPEVITRQDLLRRQAQDRKQRLTYLASRHPRWQKSYIASAMIELDMMEWKFRSGYYTTLAKDFSTRLRDGKLPKFSMYERVSMFTRHARTAGSNFLAVQWRQAFAAILEGIVSIPEAYARITTQGPLAIYREGMKRFHERPEQVAKMAELRKRQEVVRNAFYSSPVYRWWTQEEGFYNPNVTVRGMFRVNPIKRLVQHLNHVFSWQRANWDKIQPTLITADLHLKNNFAQWFSKRWKTNWTPQILGNWQAMGRLMLKVKEAFFPGSVTRELRERFSIGPGCIVVYRRSLKGGSAPNYQRHLKRIIDLAEGIGPNCSDPLKFQRDMGFGLTHRVDQSPVPTLEDQLVMADQRQFLVAEGCLLMEGFLNELVFLVTYCANDFMPQLPPFKRAQLVNESGFWWFMNEMAERGKKMFDDPGPHTISWPTPPAKDEDGWHGWMMFFKTRGLTWSRPKIHPMESHGAAWRRNIRESISNQQWMRAVMTSTFSFNEWLLAVFDDWTGLSLSMESSQWLASVDEFFYNENEDWYAGPVGFKYWALFFFRCYFQPPPGMLPQNAAINLNCKVGIGLEAAIGWVTSIMIGVFLVGSMFLPWVLIPLQIIPMGLLWLIITPTVAYHYSPRCWLMTPSLMLPGVGNAGISVPFWPFKIAFPALPFCAMDDIANLISKYTQMCICEVWWGTWLEFLCPRCMIPGGNGCPTCPTKIGFYNCQNLGLSDGVSNIFYLLLQTIPESATWINAVAQSIFFNGAFGTFMGSIGDYLTSKVDQFTNLSGDQQCQYWYCFGITLPAIGWYILVMVIVVTLFTLVWNIFLNLLSYIWAWIMAGPLPYLLPGVVAGSDPYSGLTGLQADSSSTMANSGGEPYVPVKIGGRLHMDEATGNFRRRIYARPEDVARGARRNLRYGHAAGVARDPIFPSIDRAFRAWRGAYDRFVRAVQNE